MKIDMAEVKGEPKAELGRHLWEESSTVEHIEDRGPKRDFSPEVSAPTPACLCRAPLQAPPQQDTEQTQLADT